MKYRTMFALVTAFVGACFTSPAIVPAATAMDMPVQPMAQAPVGHTKLTWYGQSAFRIVTPAGHVLYIDPWLLNPMNPVGKTELAAIDKADLVLVSHGHFDHVGETAQIVKQTNAKVVATLELGSALVHYAGVPAERAGFETLGNVGGTESFFNGEVRITFTQAVHSSSVNAKMLGVSDDDRDHAAGVPTGFIIAVRNGPTFYHTGDTALYADMAQLAKYHVSAMLVCIGDHFTMGPKDAAKAVALVHPKTAIPMHYGTFPMLTGTPAAFRAALTAENTSTMDSPLKVGETRAY